MNFKFNNNSFIQYSSGTASVFYNLLLRCYKSSSHQSITSQAPTEEVSNVTAAAVVQSTI